jgi:phage terminase large subunit-like protein
MASNQTGKTYCGSAEMAFHLTGEYPDWWEGRRWEKPVRAWAASVTSEVTRDGVQRLLCGEPSDSEALGTGLIPHAKIIETKRRPNVPNAVASVTVKHKSGGNSSLVFKSYDQGREKFQADTLDIIWLDEEPPADIYYEALTRTNATGGMVYLTFTPLLGMSDVVMRFLNDDDVATDTGLSELRSEQ